MTELNHIVLEEITLIYIGALKMYETSKDVFIAVSVRHIRFKRN